MFPKSGIQSPCAVISLWLGMVKLSMIRKALLWARYTGTDGKHHRKAPAYDTGAALTCVGLHVAVQSRLHSKALPAFVTFVWLFSSVDPNMPSQRACAIRKHLQRSVSHLNFTSIYKQPHNYP